MTLIFFEGVLKTKVKLINSISTPTLTVKHRYSQQD